MSTIRPTGVEPRAGNEPRDRTGRFRKAGFAETFFAFHGGPRTRVADTAASVLLGFAKFLVDRASPDGTRRVLRSGSKMRSALG